VAGGLLLLTELEVLAALEGNLELRLAFLAFEAEHNLLRGLGLLVEHGLRLAAKSLLLPVVAALALSKVRGFTSLVLGHLVNLVLPALFALAEGAALLGDIHLREKKEKCQSNELKRKNMKKLVVG